MNKKEPKKLNEKDCEVVKNINNKYYSVIIAPSTYVEPIVDVSGVDINDIYKSLLHASLWRSSGVSTIGTSSFFNWLKSVGLDDNEGVVKNTINSIFESISGKISKKLKSMDGADKEKFIADNKPIISMFVDAYGWPLKKDKTNLFFENSSIFSFGKGSPGTPNKSAYLRAARCIEICLENTVLGVGDAPIYIPTITDGVNKIVTLIAIFKEHDLYSIFKPYEKLVMTKINYVKVDKKVKESDTIKVDKLTKELFDKLKKGPDDVKK